MTKMTDPADTAAGHAVRLTARLPKTEQHNGLIATAADLTRAPRDVRVAVIAYDVARVIDDIDAGTDTAVVRVLRVEPVNGKRADAARRLLMEMAKTRTGQDTLPLTEFDEWAAAGEDDD